MSTPPDLSHLTVQDLLRLESAVLVELRRRGLVRTNNKPIGDVAEAVVLRARGGVLEPNSKKSHDICSADGKRIQVKAMGQRAGGRSAVFSAFRSTDFDSAVFLVFDTEFNLAVAFEATAAEIIDLARFSAHTNSHLVSLGALLSAGFVDVADEMRSAWAALSSEIRD